MEKSTFKLLKKGVKFFNKTRWTKNYLVITELFEVNPELFEVNMELFEVKQIGIRDNSYF